MDYEWLQDPEWQRAHAAALADTKRGPVFCYQSSTDPWFSSSYYFETERGVVLIDSQYFQTSAEELWSQIQENTSGQLHSIVVTHEHPDHYWGNKFFRKVAPNTPIITSAGVMQAIADTYAEQAHGTPELFQPDCLSDPADVVLPEVTFDGRMTMRFADLTLELWDCGPAECLHQVVGWIPEHRILLAGDVLSNRQTVDVAQQAVGAWREVLRDFARLKPEHVLTGHCGAAGPELLGELDDWFGSLLAACADELGGNQDPGRFFALDDAARARVVARMRAEYPQWWDSMMFEADETILEWGLRVVPQKDTGAGSIVRDTPRLTVPPELLAD